MNSLALFNTTEKKEHKMLVIELLMGNNCWKNRFVQETKKILKKKQSPVCVYVCLCECITIQLNSKMFIYLLPNWLCCCILANKCLCICKNAHHHFYEWKRALLFLPKDFAVLWVLSFCVVFLSIAILCVHVLVLFLSDYLWINISVTSCFCF